MKYLTKTLDKFNDWFCSDAGTVQTFLICDAVVLLEVLYPRIDPHAFLLMAVLTVYSAITQPALARAGRVASTSQEKILGHIERIVEHLNINGKDGE